VKVSQWERPAAPTYADEDEGSDVLGLGGISTGHSYEVTEDEERELRKERRRAQQRRKPVGFAPWPES
jgi:hypothetical protein